MDACFALALEEAHCGGLFCLEWHRYGYISFEPKYGLLGFDTGVKLTTGGYG